MVVYELCFKEGAIIVLLLVSLFGGKIFMYCTYKNTAIRVKDGCILTVLYFMIKVIVLTRLSESEPCVCRILQLLPECLLQLSTHRRVLLQVQGL